MIDNFTVHEIDKKNLIKRINLTIEHIEELIQKKYVGAWDWVYDYKSYHNYADHLSALETLVNRFNDIHPKKLSCSAEWIYYFEDFSNKVFRKLEKEDNGW
ncbi:MAG: hypothetical protein RSC93_01205 [Erysipelotrichaceae bacterium]